jgi:hypothetical protein
MLEATEISCFGYEMFRSFAVDVMGREMLHSYRDLERMNGFYLNTTLTKAMFSLLHLSQYSAHIKEINADDESRMIHFPVTLSASNLRPL